MKSNNNIEHRVAELSDIPAINELVNSAFRGESGKKGWTTESDLLDGQRTDPDSLRELITAKDSIILLFFKNSILVGCVNIQKKIDSAYVGMLTVDPNQQASGLGKIIVNIAEKFVTETLGLNTIEGNVVNMRPALLTWYEKNGFVLTGEKQPFPYNDKRFGIPKVEGLEFLVMNKKLKSKL